MAALGVPTTRSLAAVATGEMVARETTLPGAVLTRVAASHIRVGTFEFFAAREDREGLRLLADHVIARHYPQIIDHAARFRALLEQVITQQAHLVAHWMLIGFIHGVMNTDNMSIAGETIDYGPCAFMDVYDPSAVFSSIDRHGRYAYANQPDVAFWNLSRLAEALLPLISDERDAAILQAKEALMGFGPTFDAAMFFGMRRKLGLSRPAPDDAELVRDWLSLLADNRADFTLAFRRLSEVDGDPARDHALRALFTDAAGCEAWLARWRAHFAGEAQTDPDAVATRGALMRATNPAFIPRNHRVEAAIQAAVERNDFAPFEEFHRVLSKPYESQPAFAHYMDPPRPHERVLQTFCGT
jgi:uncharacterized protein YdiU (UPF0061 family)